MHQKAAEGPRRAENGAIATCAPVGGGKAGQIWPHAAQTRDLQGRICYTVYVYW